MRTSAGGPFQTVLMFAPVIAAALLAVVGFPQFDRLGESASAENPGFSDESEEILWDVGVGESPRYNAADLFQGDFDHQQLDESRLNQSQFTPPDSDHQEFEPAIDEMSSSNLAHVWFEEDPVTSKRSPDTALDGWEFANRRSKAGMTIPPSAQPLESIWDQHGDRQNDSVEEVLKEQSRNNVQAAVVTREKTDSTEVLQFDPLLPVQHVVDRKQPAVTKPLSASSSGSARFVEMNSTPARSTDARNEVGTLKEATDRLQQLGILKYRLESLPSDGRFRFTCDVTPPRNPRLSIKFEGEGNEPLQAVNNVLRQLDDWRHRQSRFRPE